MKNNTIDLNDLVVLIKNNLNYLYKFLALGIIIGLIGCYINEKIIDKKSSISINVSVTNPLNNIKLLNLFTVEPIRINNQRIEISKTQEKIENYYRISEEYLKLIFDLLDLNQYGIDKKYGHKISYTKKNEREMIFKIDDVANVEKVLKGLENFSYDLNKIIKPIIIENLFTENKYLQEFLNKQQDEENIQKISSLMNTRTKIIEEFKNQKIEILFSKITLESKKYLSNKNIIFTSILAFVSLFFMMIMLKK